jgi:hypothetical protein
MKNTLLFLSCMIGAYLSSAQKNTVHSSWRDTLIAIDGDLSDWTRYPIHNDQKLKIQYSIVNDADFLYISMRTADEDLKTKILRAGMDIWFDIRGGHKQVTAIHYPLPSNATMEPPDPESDRGMQTPEPPTVALTAPSGDMRTTGLLHIPDGILPADNLLDIRTAIHQATGTLTYELKIPFSTFYKESLSAADTLRAIAIGIVVSGLTLPPPPGGMDGPPDGGGGPGGPGGPPPGGGDMGSPPPGVAKMMAMSQSEETWIRLLLSYK